jgi:exodeoxyribonuclease VII small subunit
MARESGRADAIPSDIRDLTFEQALKALEEIVQQLESGRIDLDQSIALYTRGTLLRRHCEQKLAAAGEKVEKIVVGTGGISTAPLDVE